MTIRDFNLRHLRALAAAVRTGSIGGAAASVGISQPAVTQAINRLEAAAGARLLDRSLAGVTATDAGLLLGARGDAVSAILVQAFGNSRKSGINGGAEAAHKVTTAQLIALLSVADAGSYSAAAVETGLAQPTLHRAVQEIERICGMDLVVRSGRGIKLSAAGQHLATALRLAAAELQAAMDELAVLAGRDQGTIRIAASFDALGDLLPAAIIRFIAEHPPVRIAVEPWADDALDRLKDGRLDMLVGTGGADGVEVEAISSEQLFILARENHPVTLGPAPGLVRLAGHGWALAPKDAPERVAWETMFTDGGLFPPEPSITCPSTLALLSLVANSDLLTIGSRPEPESGLCAVGPALCLTRTISIVTRKGWAPTPAQAAFLDEIRQSGGGGGETVRF